MSLCGGCLGAGAEAGRQALEAAMGRPVALADCMNACGRPATLAFRAEGKAAWLFAGVDPVAQAGEIAAFDALYQAAPEGLVEDARPCGALRFCLIGRVPA